MFIFTSTKWKDTVYTFGVDCNNGMVKMAGEIDIYIYIWNNENKMIATLTPVWSPEPSPDSSDLLDDLVHSAWLAVILLSARKIMNS